MFGKIVKAPLPPPLSEGILTKNTFKKNQICIIGFAFRSIWPVLTIFPPYIMPNKTLWIKKLHYPPFKCGSPMVIHHGRMGGLKVIIKFGHFPIFFIFSGCLPLSTGNFSSSLVKNLFRVDWWLSEQSAPSLLDQTAQANVGLWRGRRFIAL